MKIKKTKSNAGRPRKEKGFRVNISGRIEENKLKLIMKEMKVQEFIDQAVEIFFKKVVSNE